MGPSRAARITGLEPLASGDTYPADAPRTQLDHLLGRGLSAVPGSGRAVRLELSDHRALTVEVELRG
jgi:endonuclease/exonuclease/phosphatase (EEP) superfamily protein YafD